MANAKTPGMVKRAGRAIDLRPDWEKIKVDVMYDALQLKFQDPELRAKLIATKPARLIEGNTWHDNYWGDCHCEQCKNKIGQNKLGILLQKVRG